MKDNTRIVALHKEDNGEDIVWLIELDGVKTTVGVTEGWLQSIRKKNIFSEAAGGIVDSLAEKGYVLTDKETNHLNKLLQCMT